MSWRVIDGQSKYAKLLPVSRWWYASAIANLYSKPCITSADQFRLFLRTISRKTELRLRIRSIWIVWQRTTSERKWRLSIGNRAPNIAYINGMRVIHSCPNLTDLRINCRFRFSGDSAPLARQPLIGSELCSRLRSINLSGSNDPFRNFLDSSSRYNALEQLIIQGTAIPQGIKCPSFPSLRRLEIFAVKVATIPLGITSLRILSLAGNILDSSTIVGSLHSYANQLQEVHLIGKSECKLLSLLHFQRFNNLDNLIIGAMKSDHFRALEDRIVLPPRLRMLVITTWSTEEREKLDDKLYEAWEEAPSLLPETLNLLWLTCSGPCLPSMRFSNKCEGHAIKLCIGSIGNICA
jgi:hypothetical protein